WTAAGCSRSIWPILLRSQLSWMKPNTWLSLPEGKTMTLTFDTTYFMQRHIGVSAEQRRHMLKTLGLTSIDGLIDQTLPRGIRQKDSLDLGAPLSETQLLDKMKAIAARNTEMVSLIGQGYYDTILPPVIQRNILES